MAGHLGNVGQNKATPAMIKLTREDRPYLLKLADTAASFDSSEMDTFANDSFLANLTKLQALAGQGDKALATVDNISQKSVRWCSLSWIAEETAKSGDIDLSIQLAGKISEHSYRSDALAGIARAAYSSDFGRACRIASTIENPETRWETVQTFCNWESASGKHQSAAEMACGIRFPSFRARATLALAFFDKGMRDVTMMSILLDTTHQTVNEIEDHLSRTEILLGLSDLHKSQSDEGSAMQALRDASTAASMIEDPEKSLDALLRCGIAQSALGDIDGAAQTADDIAFAAEYVDWTLSGATYELLRHKMRFLAIRGEPLEVIIPLHLNGKDSFSRAMHLASAIQILAEVGRNEDGGSLLAELIDSIEAIDPSSVGLLCGEIVLAALACGRVQDAIRTVEAIENLAGTIDDSISGVCKIVEFMSNSGNQRGASEYLALTIDKISSLSAAERIWSYEWVAKTQKTIGDTAGEQETLRILAALFHDDDGANEPSGMAANEIETRMTMALSTQDWVSADQILATLKTIPDRIRLVVTIFCGK